MAKEFQAALDAGEFSLDDLKPWKRANLAAILKDPEGWVDEHPSFATDGALGRAKYYASVGGQCGCCLPHRIAEGRSTWERL